MLDSLALIVPYALAAFLAGLLVMGWRVEIKLEEQYQERIREANVRQDVLEGALNILEPNKFKIHDAKREAIRQLNKKGEAR